MVIHDLEICNRDGCIGGWDGVEDTAVQTKAWIGTSGSSQGKRYSFISLSLPGRAVQDRSKCVPLVPSSAHWE